MGKRGRDAVDCDGGRESGGGGVADEDGDGEGGGMGWREEEGEEGGAEVAGGADEEDALERRGHGGGVEGSSMICGRVEQDLEHTVTDIVDATFSDAKRVVTRRQASLAMLLGGSALPPHRHKSFKPALNRSIAP